MQVLCACGSVHKSNGYMVTCMLNLLTVVGIWVNNDDAPWVCHSRSV